MRILLVSDIPPSSNYTAGIVLNQLCGFLLAAGHKVACFTLMDAQLQPEIPQDKRDRMVFDNIKKPRENWASPIRSFVMNGYHARFFLPWAAKMIAGFARENDSQLLWIVEQGQSIIKLVKPLADATGLPYVIQTWDSPEWWMRENHYDALTTKSVMQAYGQALKNAQCFIAASTPMEREFKEKYQCKRSKAVILGFPKEVVKPLGLHEPGTFVIAQCGQIYARKEFEALVCALEQMGWAYGGKQIFIDVYTPYLPEFHLPFPFPADRIRTHPTMLQDELLSVIGDADLLYCPYWFDPIYEINARTSFPSKLSTYLKVGRAVAVHAPDYASPSRFVLENDCGYRLTTLDIPQLVKGIKAIMDDPQREQVGARGYAAFCRHLTTECMQRDFFEALALPLPEKKEEPVSETLCVTHVNNVDLLGNRFNGYDMQQTCNEMPGIKMRQIVWDKISTDVNVIPIPNGRAYHTVQALCTEYEKHFSCRGLTQPFGRIIRKMPAYRNADIIHYHLLHNNVLSFVDLPEMTHEKPSVLTIHDPWILTGHCVYPLECTKWKTGCGDCRNLDRHFAMREDQTALMFAIRKALVSRMKLDVVVASKWMEDMVRESPITRHIEHVHRIPFGIDLEKFKPRPNEQNELRRKYGIEPENFVVFFRQDVSIYKGMTYILDALKSMKHTKNVSVLSVGVTGRLGHLNGFEGQVIELPWTTGNQMMIELYCCCDIFLMPSLSESFGLMAIEAMACAKPVVTFAGTAVEEITHAPEAGIAVPFKDAVALREAIERLQNDPQEVRDRGEKCRRLAEAEYRYEDYISRHIALYKEILQRENAAQKEQKFDA